MDFRGVYASFGQNRAYNRGEWIDAARMDAYDITEWFARQPWSSGNIGMWGCSATGGSQMQAATMAPPSLKAIFPMSAEFDAYPFRVNGGVAPPPGAPLRALPGPAGRDGARCAVDGPTAAARVAGGDRRTHAERRRRWRRALPRQRVRADREIWWTVSSPPPISTR